MVAIIKGGEQRPPAPKVEVVAQEQKYVRPTIVVKEEVYKKIQETARRRGWTISRVIVRAIEFYLGKADANDPI